MRGRNVKFEFYTACIYITVDEFGIGNSIVCYKKKHQNIDSMRNTYAEKRRSIHVARVALSLALDKYNATSVRRRGEISARFK